MTLIEVLVAMAVAALVLASAMGAVLAQQRTFLAGSRLREAQAQGRLALGRIEYDLAMAGYGLDPALALDFNILGCPTPGGAAAPACARDRQNGPDELVVAYRDPRYWGRQLNPALGLPQGKAWRVTAASVTGGGASVTLAQVKPGLLLPKGQVLQLVCSSGAGQAYVTVPSAVDTRSAPGVADTTITFPAAAGPDPFHQPSALAAGCFAGGSARAFLVVRHRYYVRAFPAAGDPAGTPYLMLDTGTDTNGDGAVSDADHLPVAEGVEDLQLAYERPISPTAVARVGDGASVLALCPLSGRPLTAGACTGDLRYVEWSSAADAANSQGWSYLGLDSGGAVRNAPHVANIRFVSAAITLRSTTRDVNRTGTPPPVHYNRDATTLPAPGGYQRTTFVTGVAPINLQAAALSYL